MYVMFKTYQKKTFIFTLSFYFSFTKKSNFLKQRMEIFHVYVMCANSWSADNYWKFVRFELLLERKRKIFNLFVLQGLTCFH